MKNRILILSLCTLCILFSSPLHLFAQRLERLGDSLTCFAQSHASVDKVVVKACRERGRQIELTTNPTLSYLSLNEEELRTLREQVSIWVRGDKQGQVRIYSDGKELDELITSRFRPRRAKDRYRAPRVVPLVRNTDLPYDDKQGLRDRHIALWASHGLYYKADEDRWIWQRARLWTTVEDLFTSSFTYPFLVPMLENAGAVVLQPRERDPQTRERIAYSNGTFCQSLAMPEQNRYALYVRYEAGKNRPTQTHYTVTHQGQTTLFTVNQQIGGGLWQYIGTFLFGTDSLHNHLTVTHPDGSTNGISHVGVKIGGGIGESGYPRFAEAARYYLRFNGLPDTVYTHDKKPGDYLDDLVSRGKWVNYVNERLHIPLDMALAVHSDAGVRGGDSIVGTLAIYSDKDKQGGRTFLYGGNRHLNRDLADYVQTQIVQDMQQTLCPEWSCRELKNGAYVEAATPHIPTLLIEMLSHQNAGDMRYGLNPTAKFVIARAIYKGMLRFLHEQDGTPYVVQPLPVQAMGITRTAGTDSVRICWQARTDSLEPSANPDYYILYTRSEDTDWDNGRRVNDTTVSLLLPRGKRMEFQVRAGNNGGVSLPGETLCAYIAPKDDRQAVIINGFHQVAAPVMVTTDSMTGGILPRSYAIAYGTDIAYIGDQIDYDRRHPWVSDDECGFGMCANDYAAEWTRGNTFDQTVQHGQMLQTMDYSYVSTSLEAWRTLPSATLIDLTMGLQTDGLTALTTEQQELLNRFVTAGGKLLVSGSYLLSGSNLATALWAQTTLHCRLKAPQASQSGRLYWQPAGQPTQTCQLHTVPNGQALPCAAPDGLEPVMMGERVARYQDSGLTAAVATGHRILVLAFAMESLQDFGSLYQQCIHYLNND